jgi:signal transduction histidine kinase
MILLVDDLSSQLLKVLNSWSNPFLLILFIAIIIIFLILFTNRYLLKPLEQRYIQEKKEIELRNSRMMALFAELDPDPVIRVDMEGKVNFYNEAANKLLNIVAGDDIRKVELNITLDELKKLILNNESFNLPFLINSVYYNVLIKGNTALGIAQFYLRDISEIKILELKLKQLSNHLQNQLDEERFRIAHELHDGIAQDLYLVKMGLRNVQDESNNSVNALVKSLEDQLDITTEELRRIIYDLKPKILDEMGLEPALQTLCNNVIKETNLNGSVEILGLDKRLNRKKEIYIYRVIQEALSNIIKHSGATEFSIILMKDKEQIRTIVTDNGCGLNGDLNKKDTLNGFGLLNIKERTEGLGGIFKIDSNEGEGLSIITEVPLE